MDPSPSVHRWLYRRLIYRSHGLHVKKPCVVHLDAGRRRYSKQNKAEQNAFDVSTTSSCQRRLPQTEFSPGHARPRFRHALVVSSLVSRLRRSLLCFFFFVFLPDPGSGSGSGSGSHSHSHSGSGPGPEKRASASHALVPRHRPAKEACPLDCRGCTWAAHAKVCADDLYLTSAPLYYVSNAR